MRDGCRGPGRFHRQRQPSEQPDPPGWHRVHCEHHRDRLYREASRMTFRRLSLRRDESGAALVELALTAPFFAALLIGIIDLSRAYSMKYKLEQSAQRAVEKIEQQHSVQTDYSSYATEASTAATAAGY